MKNTRKKRINKTNNKTRVKRCMENFVEKKVKYWTEDFSKEIKKLENRNLTKEEQKKLNHLKKQKKNQTYNLKKQYKLYNCNVNCKNTLLEPGSPNQLPKTFRNEYNNNKKIIKVFTKRRKEIFKNKKNVLIDNFYENTPELIKKKLIREGAISNCIPPLLYNSNQNGGSVIYENGDILETIETFNGMPFFRKVFYNNVTEPNSEKQIRLSKAANAEIIIANILVKNPFPNIVTFYEINKNYIEMEELDIKTKLNPEKVKEIMKNVKDFLQNLGIMYIDWKTDNIGISKDGTYKLFDFDASGLIDLKTNNWIVEPLEYYSYDNAIKNGCITPQQIDDFSFNKEIMGLKNK